VNDNISRGSLRFHSGKNAVTFLLLFTFFSSCQKHVHAFVLIRTVMAVI